MEPFRRAGYGYCSPDAGHGSDGRRPAPPKRTFSVDRMANIQSRDSNARARDVGEGELDAALTAGYGCGNGSNGWSVGTQRSSGVFRDLTHRPRTVMPGWTKSKNPVNATLPVGLWNVVWVSPSWTGVVLLARASWVFCDTAS